MAKQAETVDQAAEPLSELDVDPAAGQIVSECAPGGCIVDNCRIDLPPDDVVEEIEYERFFRLPLTFGALMGPAPGISPSMPDVDTDPGSSGGFDFRALSVALYMPFTQQWKLDGYSRGRVVNSFSLGPGEEQAVEIFTWDRKSTSLESSTSFDSEQTTESSGSRRDTTDVSRDVARQAGVELTSEGKVGFKVGIVDVDASAGMSARAGVNEGEETTRSLIVDATSRSTGNVRTSRTLKVTESREFGREEKVTRKLRNPNMCHTLTVPFFEVLANYCVTTLLRTTEVRLVLLIPNSELTQLAEFDRLAVRVYETTLRLALLERSLAPGFDAARLLDAKDRACEILCQGCSCGDETPDTGGTEWIAVVTAARAVAAAAATNRATAISLPPTVALLLTPASYEEGLRNMRRYAFAKALATHAPRLLADVGAVGIPPEPAPVSVSQVQALLRALAGASVDLLTVDANVGKAVFNDLRDAVALGMVLVGGVDPFLGVRVMTVVGRVAGDTGNFAQYTDDGLLPAINAFGAAYAQWQAKQAAERAADEKRRELARIAKEERDVRILQTFGLRETADAQERLAALLVHLNDPRNIDHYRYAVWNERSGGATDKVMALALAGITHPVPVGVVGHNVAVTVRLEHEPRWSAFFNESIADLVEHTVGDERRHILPTAALYAESIVGECCACEENIITKQRHEADEARWRNELIRLEKNRLEMRLDANPPLIDKEYSPPCQVSVLCGAHCTPDSEEGVGDPTQPDNAQGPTGDPD